MQNEVKSPAHCSLGQAECDQITALKVSHQHNFRQAAYTQPGFHCVFDGLIVAKLKIDIDTWQEFSQCLFKGLTGTGLRLAQNPFGLGNVLRV